MAIEPWSKWFWTDYEADPGLRMSSLAAQGLWMRMLCLMAKAQPKGELRVGSEPCTMADLAVYVGQPEETVAILVSELERWGVFSRSRAGVIYNRRLRNDAELSKKRAKAGAKGAEATNRKIKDNPDLPRQTHGNSSGKSPAPEARSQKLEARTIPLKSEHRDSARPPELPAAVRAVMEAGGFVAPPADLALLDRWREAGADLEQDIVPVVRTVARDVRERTGRAPFKLQLFDQPIREKLAADQREIERLRNVTARYANGAGA